jgi:tetratricopeptide (TPR) repeat protein
MLVAAGIATGIALRNSSAESRSGAEPVLVVGAIQDRRNANDAGMGTVSDLLATSLARVDGVHVVSTARVYELLAQMRANVERPSQADIAAAARQAGATELVDGTVYELPDGRLRLDFRRSRIATGELVGSHTLVGADLFALVDSGTVRLARDFGARVASGSIANVTTASEIAYRFYEEGLRQFVRNDFPRAHEMFEAALREDSTFALAAFRAAVTTDVSEPIRRVALLERARRLAARATDRERLTIQAGWAFYTGNPSLLAIAETLAVRYPHEVEGYYYKGTTLKLLGRNAEAIPPLQRVVALDSLALSANRARCSACDALAWLAVAYLGLDSVSAALRETQRWIRLQPESYRSWLTLSSIMLSQRRVGEATEAYNRALAIEPSLATDRGLIDDFWIRQGRPDIAEEKLRALGAAGEARQRHSHNWYLAIALKEQRKMGAALAAAAEARSVRRPPPEDTLVLESVLLQQQVYLEAGQANRAAALMDTLVNRPSNLPPQWQASLRAWALTHRASALFAAGDTAALAQIIEPMERYGKETLGRHRVHHYARGLLYEARGNLEAAAAELPLAIASSDGGFGRARFHLAIVLLRLGRTGEAVKELQNVLRGSIEGGNLYISHAEIHELLGNAWEILGQPDSAAVHYRTVIKSWQHADPEFRARREIVAGRLQELTR